MLSWFMYRAKKGNKLGNKLQMFIFALKSALKKKKKQIGETLPNKEVFIGLLDRASAQPPPLFEVLIYYQDYTCKKGKK